MRGEGRERREMRREGKVRDEREVVTSTSTYNCVHTGIHTHTYLRLVALSPGVPGLP